jgi:hypothetical protein
LKSGCGWGGRFFENNSNNSKTRENKREAGGDVWKAQLFARVVFFKKSCPELF